eukprot:TRINITY_DN18674_c0_g1_i2.p1 TRINITY_DN18674_c0_g1~~TRINITY_DN18674_c0_g1_i2.p1  ORF type:complete len:778 (-),score=94.87 TRINITY_DN18674_c0_g1_i2:81-2414(-)
MPNAWLFAGLFLQCLSHAYAAVATSVGDVSSSCGALLADITALKDALATMWQLRDTPDSQYPPTTRTAALCAWTAMQQQLNSVQQEGLESGLDGRLLAGLQKNATSECDAANDDGEIFDAEGFSCRRWSYMDCYKELGYSPSQLDAIRQRCPFSCAGCAQEASVERHPEVEGYWSVVIWLYRVMLVGGSSCGLYIHMKSSSSGCFQQLTDALAKLKLLAWGAFGFRKRNGAQNSQIGLFVRRTKATVRRRCAVLILLAYALSATPTLRHMMSRAPCFQRDMHRSHPLTEAIAWLVQWSLPMCFVLPSTLVGERGITIVGFLITLASIAREFDGHGAKWYIGWINMSHHGIWRLLPLLIHRPLVAASFELLHACAIIAGYALRFGTGAVVYLEARAGTRCHVWEATDGVGNMSFDELLLWSVCLSCFVALIVYVIDMLLELGCTAMGHLAHMECQEKVLLSLMTHMCDCVVYLDSNLAIREPAHGLTALLPCGGQHLDGTDFRSLLASAEDKKLLSEALLGLGSSPKVLHLQLEGAVGTQLHLQVYWSSIEEMDGSKVFILGLTEDSERCIPPPDPLGNLPQSDDRSESIRMLQHMQAAYTERCHSQMSQCSSLRGIEISLTVMVSWPMAIFDGVGMEGIHHLSSFAEFFSNQTLAEEFHSLIEYHFNEIVTNAGSLSFPFFRELGTWKLHLVPKKEKQWHVYVVMEVTRASESIGAESINLGAEEGQDASSEDTEGRSIVLHLSSARRKMVFFRAHAEMLQEDLKERARSSRVMLAI